MTEYTEDTQEGLLGSYIAFSQSKNHHEKNLKFIIHNFSLGNYCLIETNWGYFQ